jgi:FlaA1/EpsC-like NDP-sugar epimerase
MFNGGEVSYNLEDLLERKPIVLDDKAISAQLNGKSVLITGAAGSIGSEMVRQVLTFSPASIIMLDQAETPLYLLGLEMHGLASLVQLHTVLCDITRKDALKEVFKQYKPDVVYHAAAYKHVPMLEDNPVQAVLVNVLGTKNVADLVNDFNVGTFVMISTDKAVNPGSVMGASKLIAEKYVQALHNKLQGEGRIQNKYITTRFGNVLGSNGSVVPVFAKQILAGGPVTVTHPEITRYFMTLMEACQLVLEAGAMGKSAEIFIFYMGKQVKILDLAHKMIRLAGLEPEKDIEIKLTGLRPGEKLNEELINAKTTILPTHNEFIMIAQEEPMDFLHVFDNVEAMVKYAKNYQFNETVAQMKQLLPDFRSKNSQYQIFDNRDGAPLL